MPLQSVEFERPIVEIEKKIEELRIIANGGGMDVDEEIRRLEKKARQMTRDLYLKLNRWQRTLLARHPKRPYTLDYISHIFTEFTELDGDRRIGADHAIVAGPAMLDDRAVMIVGHQKGRDIQQRAFRNFAMCKPEGYRKAVRMFDIAERFRLPVVTFIDTPAADPGVESEMRGISEAIAASMLKMFELTVPVVSVVIGEGGSGGAIGIAVANKVLMQEHAIYSVIPPEGCAAILWRDPDKGPQAAAALKLTSEAAMEFELIDEVLPEPFGDAHRNVVEAADTVRQGIRGSLKKRDKLGAKKLKVHRYERFRSMGRFDTV